MSQGGIRPIKSPAFSPASAKYGRLLPPPLIGGRVDSTKALRNLGLAMIESAGRPSIDNDRVPAAYTYFGQFIDHDLTLDLVSTFEAEIDQTASRNFRTAALELDSLYGLGPHGSPFLYRQRFRDQFRLGEVRDATDGGDLELDLPRLEDGTALIADPRNDENLLVSQLTVAFLRLHNRFADEQTDKDWRDRHKAAKQMLRWHYQWVVLNDYLPRVVGEQFVRDLLSSNRRLYDPIDEAQEAFIPIEFSVAAFRFGHSQVRASYRINAQTQESVPTFPAPPLPDRFELPGVTKPRPSLQGGPVRQRDVVNWSFLIGEGDDVQRSLRIGPRLSEPLRALPVDLLRDAPERGVLAVRNLLRGAHLRLPDGRAAAMFAAALISTSEIQPLDEATIWSSFEPYRLAEVPLWFYILREAELHGDSGRRLAGLGARIVAETIIGVLQKDPCSILRDGKNFEPRPDLMHQGKFDLEALLRAAGMPFVG